MHVSSIDIYRGVKYSKGKGKGQIYLGLKISTSYTSV